MESEWWDCGGNWDGYVNVALELAELEPELELKLELEGQGY